jgi:signal transduction histidine kinase
LVQTIVAAHGGAASAENRPEGGAAVTLRIPLTRQAL